jgi:hypothetical protein
LAQLWTDQGKRAKHRGFLATLADRLGDGPDADGFAWTKILPDNLADL